MTRILPIVLALALGLCLGGASLTAAEPIAGSQQSPVAKKHAKHHAAHAKHAHHGKHAKHH